MSRLNRRKYLVLLGANGTTTGLTQANYEAAFLDGLSNMLAAAYVDEILRGARAGDLPVEQPERFDVVLNLAAARAVGITFRETAVLQATEVLQ
jgi:hypothetical protein